MVKTIGVMLLAGLLSANAQTISEGASRQDVISQFGEPQGTVRSGIEETLSYRDVEVQLQNGRVVKVLRLNERPLAAKTSATATNKPSVETTNRPATITFTPPPATNNQPVSPQWMQKSRGFFSERKAHTGPDRRSGLDGAGCARVGRCRHLVGDSSVWRGCGLGLGLFVFAVRVAGVHLRALGSGGKTVSVQPRRRRRVWNWFPPRLLVTLTRQSSALPAR